MVKKKKAKKKVARRTAKKVAAPRAIVASKMINGEKWIWWSQGGAEFLVKAVTIGRIRENPTGPGIFVAGAGGELRVNTTVGNFIEALEAD